MQILENTKRDVILNFRVTESEKKKIKVMEHLKNQSIREILNGIADIATENLDIESLYDRINKPNRIDVDDLVKMNKKDRKKIIKQHVQGGAEMYLNSPELLIEIPLDLIDD